MELTLFKSSKNYLVNVLNGRFDTSKLPPITKWTAEREKLTADLEQLNSDYICIRDDVSVVDQIKRNAVDILDDRPPTPTQRKRSQDMER